MGKLIHFGIFNHMDRGPVPLGPFYESRLKLVEQYDRLGFHAYHVAKHYATPLGHAPATHVISVSRGTADKIVSVRSVIV